MRTKSGYLHTVVGETIGVLCALTFCQGWLLGEVDQLSGFWHAGERHDYFLPGEGLMLLTVAAITVAAAVILALRGVAQLTHQSISRKAAVIVSLPSTMAGLVAYEFAVARVVPKTVILSVDAVFLFAACGCVLGSLFPARVSASAAGGCGPSQLGRGDSDTT
jgi:hypothetical protein